MVGAMEVKKGYMPYFEPLYAKIVENKWAGVEAAQKLKVDMRYEHIIKGTSILRICTP